MTENTNVLVVGATGNQGGAVVDHLLASDHDFDVRGLTRDASSDAAQALEERDVTMQEGDLNDPSSRSRTSGRRGTTHRSNRGGTSPT
jgi:uncharacterized protein YbjT (DUF2867 family)